MLNNNEYVTLFLCSNVRTAGTAFRWHDYQMFA